MEVAVWDTYVTRKDGRVMHFDIIVPAHLKDAFTIHTFGKEYLKQKGEDNQELTSKQCQFCHIEQASPEIISDIQEKGFYIVELNHCD